MTDIDFDKRALCPDGNCIGVLDDEGRCKVCGGGKTSASAADDAGDDFDDGDDDLYDDEMDEDVGEEAPAIAASADFADRELCPDGACIGVIGTNGKCKECGRSRGS